MRSLYAKDPKRYAIEALCRLFGKSKQAYHKYDEDKALAKAARVDFAIQFVHATREEDHGIGGQLLYVMYKKELGPTGDSLGRDVFYRILDEYGLKLRLKLRGTRTTDSTHGLPTYPNLVKDFIPNGSNQLWVSDITYIRIWLDEHTYVFCYLSLILDAYSEEIVGWSVGPDLSTKYPLEALKMALKRLDGVPSEDIHLIHHSDRGVQYASAEYVKMLLEHNITISMTETGNPEDNPQAERINNTMKNELLKGLKFHSIAEVVAAITKAVNFYNNRRPHMSLGYMTPVEAVQCTGELDKRWYSYREAAIKRAKDEQNQESAVNPENCLPLLSQPLTEIRTRQST